MTNIFYRFFFVCFFLSLSAHAVTVLTPNGGETYNHLQQVSITYDAPDGEVFNVYYSSNGGSNYTLLGTDTASSDGNLFEWQLLFQPPTSNGLIRLVNVNNGSDADISDAVFSILNSEIILFQPNPTPPGIITDAAIDISWASIGAASTVVLQYTVNSGSSWISIDTLPASSGYYSWIVPTGLNSSQVRVKIYDISSPSLNYDISDYDFSIFANSPVLYYPYAGAYMLVGNNIDLIFNSDGVPLLNFYYSIDYGTNWVTIATNVPGSQNTLPFTLLPTDQDYLFMVEDAAFPGVNLQYYGPAYASSFPPPAPAVDLLNPVYYTFLNAGQTENIYFMTNGAVPAINIDFSSDYGTTWTPVVTNYPAGNSPYLWTVPNVGTQGAYLKAYDPAFPNDFSLSGNFIITGASISINSPLYGEFYPSNALLDISWSAAALSNVDIEISYDNGGNYSPIVTNFPAATGLYSYQLTGLTGINSRIRISESGNPSVNAVSDAFNIGVQSINLSFFGDMESGAPADIYYTSVGVNNVDVLLSTDSGNTYNPLVLNEPVAFWVTVNMPVVAAPYARLIIRDAANASVADTSQWFIITPDSLSIYTPNGGNNFTSGNLEWLQWDAFFVDSVLLSYSYDGGANWVIIDTVYFANFYNWLVPNTPSTQCLARVQNLNDLSVEDVSDAYFTIISGGPPACASGLYPPDAVTGYNPYGILGWVTPQGIFEDFKIYLGTSANPPLIDTISMGPYSLNGLLPSTTYYWKVVPFNINGEPTGCIVQSFTTAPSTTICMNNVSDTICSGIFTDAGGLNANYPVNQTLEKTIYPATPGQVLQINFTSFSTTQNYDELEIFDGENVSAPQVGVNYSGTTSPGNIVATNPAGAFTFRWNSTFVGPDAGWEASISCVTASTGAINLISPNGGELLTGNTPYTIQWTSSNVNQVNIEYSIDSGSTWSPVVSNYGNTNSYIWQVPLPASTHCFVRVSDASNALVSDQSNAEFIIQYVPVFIDLQYPNGAESFLTNSSVILHWTSMFVTEVTIEYSDDAGTNWYTIDAAHATSDGNNYYNWVTPLTPSNLYLIRISDNNSSANDMSTGAFYVKNPFIDVTAPNGGETLNGGAFYLINWTSLLPTSYVKLEYSTDNGANWNLIANPIYNSGNFNWSIPNIPSSNCKIRVSQTANPTVFDESDQVFTINATVPSISLIQPNGGQTLYSNNQTYITWSSNLIAQIDVHYSLNNGSTWITLANGFVNTGYYNWSIPDTVSTNAKVRVRSTLDTTVLDISNSTFNIQHFTGTPSLNLLSPNGGQVWTTGTLKLISWQSFQLSGTLTIEYSSDGGANWNLVTNNATVNNNNYWWMVPAALSNQYKIRITSNANPGLMDESASDFTVSSASQTITMNDPNGGEALIQNTWYNTTWNRQNIPLVNLKFSSDNGSNWTTVLDSVNADSYYWPVPNILSSQCLMRIENAADTTVFDESDAPFDIGLFVPNGNSLVVDSLSSLGFCKGDTLYIYFHANGTYNPGNHFDAQLSDSVGNFSINPTLIGTLYSTANSGVITAVIPMTVGNGIAYRIRITSSDLPSLSNDNGNDISIQSPQFDFAANILEAYIPGQNAVTFYVIPAQPPSAVYSWTFGDGGTDAVSNPIYVYNNIGYYDVGLTIENNGCIVTVSKPAYIRVEQLFPSYGLNTNTTQRLKAVDFLNDSVGVFVMEDGNLLLTSDGGNTFTTSVTGLVGGNDSLSSATLYPNHWMISGSNGLIKKSVDNGQNWTSMTPVTGNMIYGCATVSPNLCFAVGDQGTVLNYDGSNWTPQTSGTAARLWAVTVDTNNTGSPKAYAVGASGTILKYDAGNWTTLNSGFAQKLKAVTVTGPDVIYAAGGIIGTVLKSTDGGSNWNIVLSGVNAEFTGVTGIADTAWACATNGLVYETRDGGISWIRYSVGGTYDNTGINWKARKGYVVGNGGHGRVFGLPAGATSGIDTTQSVKWLKLHGFEMFPNPASGLVTVKVGQKLVIDYIAITSLNGKQVKNINPVAKSNQLQFSVADVVPGIYFVELGTGSYRVIKKLVVIK